MLKHKIFRLREPLFDLMEPCSQFALLMLDVQYYVDFFHDVLLALKANQADVVTLKQFKQFCHRCLDLCRLYVLFERLLEAIERRVLLDFRGDLVEEYGGGVEFA